MEWRNRVPQETLELLRVEGAYVAVDGGVEVAEVFQNVHQRHPGTGRKLGPTGPWEAALIKNGKHVMAMDTSMPVMRDPTHPKHWQITGHLGSFRSSDAAKAAVEAALT